jgi:creatinine amidohydrolase
MGLDRAYTGAPAEATREEGDELYGRLAEMIVTEVLESLRL